MRRKKRSAEAIIMRALLKPTNWKPDLSKISTENKIAVSSVHSIYNRLKKRKAYQIVIKEVYMSEQEW